MSNIFAGYGFAYMAAELATSRADSNCQMALGGPVPRDECLVPEDYPASYEYYLICDKARDYWGFRGHGWAAVVKL